MNVPGRFGIPMTEEQYAENWSKSSAKHVSDGDYDWLAGLLPKSKIILEVGCGSGAATSALVSAGKKVVAVEVNSHCVAETVKNLSADGVAVRSFSISQLTPNSLDDCDAILIHGDILDSNIDRALGQFAYDGVVCWLIGAAPARVAALVHKDVNKLDGSEMPIFRERIHERCGDLGRSLLAEDGFIHVVDRVGFPTGSNEDLARLSSVENYESLLNAPFKVPLSNILFRPTGATPTQSLMNYVAPSFAAEMFVTGAPLLISVMAKKLETGDWGSYAASEERLSRTKKLQSMMNEINQPAVQAVLSMPSAKIGRNDRCPCGSGKKYKKCHGAAGIA